MTSANKLEYGVCMPAEDEAVSSWVSRLALAQGCTLQEMLDFLELQPYPDIDAAFLGTVAATVRQKCGLPSTAFHLVECANTAIQLRGIDRVIRLRHTGNTPRFRYCPACLREEGVATVPYQWRFREWRYCPIHCCLMEDRCWSCNLAVRYPFDMADSRAGQEGHGTQRRCMRCSADLAALSPCELVTDEQELVSATETHWLMDGQTQIDLLFTQRLSEEDWKDLAEIARRGCLPGNDEWAASAARLRAYRSNPVFHPPRVRPDIRQNWVRRAYFAPEGSIYFTCPELWLPGQIEARRAFQLKGEWWCRREVKPW